MPPAPTGKANHLLEAFGKAHPMAEFRQSIFLHIRIVMGTVISPGVERVLVRMARPVQEDRRHGRYFVHLTWAAWVLPHRMRF